MASISIKADASGKTLEELSKLLERRINDLGEGSRKAVGAIAINALISIRAATKKRRRGKRVVVNG